MAEFPIDIVFPFVNNQDPVWQSEYEKYKDIKSSTPNTNTEVRYRDWGTLKYLLRSIETYVPWYNKIFLLLSYPSQVPDWLDVTNKRLRIVYLYDYIPEQYLPCFNSTVIETLVHLIPDLSEHFLHGCDDFFFCKPIKREDFFTDDGKLVMNLTKHKTNFNEMYSCTWENCAKFGMQEHNKYEFGYHYNTDHGWTPMRKSTLKHLWDYWGEELYKTITPVRSSINVNEHLPHHYELSINNIIPSRIKNKHIRVDVNDFFKETRNLDTFAIEDVPVKDFEKTKKKLLLFMDCMYPIRSSFEKEPVNQDKLVSIIVPVYNLKDYIIRTLDSIKEQTYKNFECIIVDDGSTDETGQIVKEYCKTDKRFKYYQQEKSGVGEARNLGIEKSKGEYITFSDGDDINEANKLEALIDFLNNNEDFDFCYGMQKKIFIDGSIKDWGVFFPNYINIEQPEKAIVNGNFIFYVNLLCIRKKMLRDNDIKFYNIINGEDAIFCITLMTKLTQTAILNLYVYSYLERENSLVNTAKGGGINMEQSLDILNAERDFINNISFESDTIKNYVYVAENTRLHFFKNHLYGKIGDELFVVISKIKNAHTKNNKTISNESKLSTLRRTIYDVQRIRRR